MLAHRGGRVRYVGEPVAAVVAPDRFWPRNAFDLIEVPAAYKTRRPNLSRADAGRAPSTCPQGKHGARARRSCRKLHFVVNTTDHLIIYVNAN